MKSYCAESLGGAETGCAGDCLFMYDDKMVNRACKADTDAHATIANVCLTLLQPSAEFIVSKHVIKC
jgi:hypothetical protein